MNSLIRASSGSRIASLTRLFSRSSGENVIGTATVVSNSDSCISASNRNRSSNRSESHKNINPSSVHNNGKLEDDDTLQIGMKRFQRTCRALERGPDQKILQMGMNHFEAERCFLLQNSIPCTSLHEPRIAIGIDRNINGATELTQIPFNVPNVLKGVPVDLRIALADEVFGREPLIMDMVDATKIEVDKKNRNVPMEKEIKDVLHGLGDDPKILKFTAIRLSIPNGAAFNALKIVDSEAPEDQKRDALQAYWVPQGKCIDIPINPGEGEPDLVFTPGFSGCSLVAEKIIYVEVNQPIQHMIRVYHVEGGKENEQYNELKNNKQVVYNNEKKRVEHREGMINVMAYRDYGYHINDNKELINNIQGSAFMQYDREQQRWQIKYQSISYAPNILSMQKEQSGFFSRFQRQQQKSLELNIQYLKQCRVVKTDVILLK